MTAYRYRIQIQNTLGNFGEEENWLTKNLKIDRWDALMKQSNFGGIPDSQLDLTLLFQSFISLKNKDFIKIWKLYRNIKLWH